MAAIKKRKTRVCASEGCTTILSIYNKGRYCSPCDDPRAIRLPTAHVRKNDKL
jgi:hypothetical protein